MDALREEENTGKRRRYEDRFEKVINDMTDLVETLLTYVRLDKNIAHKIAYKNPKLQIDKP